MLQKLKKMLLRASGFLYQDRHSKVIFYHDLFETVRYTDMATPVSLFLDHLQTADKTGFHAVTQIEKDKNEFQICFDDGFRGIYDCRQLWEKLDWRPTIFLAVDLIGKENYLSPDQICELQQDGFRFQSHGLSHQVLTGFSDEELEREILQSRESLSELLKEDVREICFPVGLFSQKVLDVCRKAGYDMMYSSIPGNRYDEPFPGVLRRNLVQFYEAAEFQAVLLGGLIPFQKRYFRMHCMK